MVNRDGKGNGGARKPADLYITAYSDDLEEESHSAGSFPLGSEKSSVYLGAGALNMMMPNRNAALAVALFFVSLAANSATITWEVDITLFADPGNQLDPDPSVGRITGTFVFDTDTLDISGVSISATGSTFAAGSASLTDAFGPYESVGARIMEFLPTAPTNDLTGVEDVLIKLDPPGLGIAGGTIDVTSIALYTCNNSDCSDFSETYSETVAGTVTALAPVPVPAAAWLFGSALLCAAGLRRRKS